MITSEINTNLKTKHLTCICINIVLPKVLNQIFFDVILYPLTIFNSIIDHQTLRYSCIVSLVEISHQSHWENFALDSRTLF